MRRIQVTELKEWIDQGKQLQIIDIREPEEFELAAIAGSVNIPKNKIPHEYEKVKPDVDSVIICRFGTKSAATARFLISKGYNQDMFYLLDGGIYEWASDIDKSMPAHLL